MNQKTAKLLRKSAAKIAKHESVLKVYDGVFRYPTMSAAGIYSIYKKAWNKTDWKTKTLTRGKLASLT